MKNEESIPQLTKERNLVTFWETAEKHEIAGNVLYDKVLWIKIVTPGDNKSDALYEVEREYPEGYPNPVFGKVKKNGVIFERFAEQIQKFKDSLAGAGLRVDGTPIEEWAQVDIRQVALLKHHGVYSVESLAALSDAGSGAIGLGGRELVKKAQTWVKQKEDDALSQKQQSVITSLTSRLDAMQDQMDAMGEALDALPPEEKAKVQAVLVKRGPGRPRKDQAAA